MSAVASFLSAYQPSPVICHDTAGATRASRVRVAKVPAFVFPHERPGRYFRPKSCRVALELGCNQVPSSLASPQSPLAERSGSSTSPRWATSYHACERPPSSRNARHKGWSASTFPREAWSLLAGHFSSHLSRITSLNCPLRQTRPVMQAVITVATFLLKEKSHEKCKDSGCSKGSPSRTFCSEVPFPPKPRREASSALTERALRWIMGRDGDRSA